MNKKEKIENIDNGSLDGSGAAPTNNTPSNNKRHQQEVVQDFDDLWKYGKPGDGELLADYMDREVIIEGYDQLGGDYGPYVIIDVKIDNKRRRLRTSSKIIIHQLACIVNQLPVKARIVKKMGKNGNEFYSFA